MRNIENNFTYTNEELSEKLLGRNSVAVIGKRSREFFAGRTVLVTGGGGSIGSELIRQISALNPKAVVVLDISENGAYEIEQEIKGVYGRDYPISVEIASVTDYAASERVFEEFRPDIVFHLAAHKHVPLMEHNAAEAVRNNVGGMRNLVSLAKKYGVRKFIAFSTDKAVNPTSVMGATKRICEMMTGAPRTDGETIFASVRFGNVFASDGSVIPLFMRQIKGGGPITLTDKNAERYFMTVKEAVILALEACVMAKGAEIFLFDMGAPVKMIDIAERLIGLSGLEPYRDIDIQLCGLRPGEKIKEELFSGADPIPTEHANIYSINAPNMDSDKLNAALDELLEAAAVGDKAEVISRLKIIVPEYCGSVQA